MFSRLVSLLLSTPLNIISITTPWRIFFYSILISIPVSALHCIFSQWRACDDANFYTWHNPEYDHYFSGLDAELRQKLARSAGYCPHIRCQLESAPGVASPGNACPAGLCYTMLEVLLLCLALVYSPNHCTLILIIITKVIMIRMMRYLRQVLCFI